MPETAQQQLANVSLEDPVRSSPVASFKNESLYSNQPIFSGATPNSLRMMIYNSKSFKSSHSAFPAVKKSVCFDSVDYGYGEEAPVEERATKRRRMERRNSKTPAMLMALTAQALEFDFLDKADDEISDDSWDGGLAEESLDIAEELVKHLQQRREAAKKTREGVATKTGSC
jgi:hypothetical protein